MGKMNKVNMMGKIVRNIKKPGDFKRGAASNSDVEFIKKNSETMSDEQIAEALNRSVGFVSKIRIQQPVILKAEESTDIITALRVKHWWSTIRKQLFDDEITFFESNWANLNTQFEDVVPTDELVLRDLIMYDILSNRNLTQQKNVMDTIHTLQSQINAEYKLSPELRDRGSLSDWNTQINSCRAAHLSLQKSYSDIDDRKSKAFQSLKATRDQRFKQLKESKHDFFELIRELNTRDSRLKEGRYASLFLEAVNREKDRLETEIDFTGNNDMGIPYLNPELVQKRYEESLIEIETEGENNGK